MRGTCLLLVAFASMPLLAEGSTEADKYLTRGIRAYNKKQFDQAIEQFSIGLRASPGDFRLLLHRGNAHAEAGALGKAIADYDSAITHNPRAPGAHYAKGVALTELGNEVDAIRCYDRAIEIKADYQAALLNRAWLLRKAGNWAQALKDYDRLIQLQPEKILYRLARASLLIKAGELEKAVAGLDEALVLEPRNTKALSERGDAWHLLGRDEEAIADYEKAIKLGAKDGAVYNNLAALLMKRPGSTRTEWSRAVELGLAALRLVKDKAHRAAIYDGLADVYKKLGDESAAAHYARLSGKTAETDIIKTPPP